MPPIITRFAVAPDGYLHLGHAFAARFASVAAKNCEGTLGLRLDDLDSARAKPEYRDAILEDLTWLGLVWEEPVFQQSAHVQDYQVALEKLDAMSLIRRIDGAFGQRLILDEQAASALVGPLSFEEWNDGIVEVQPALVGQVELSSGRMPFSPHLTEVVDDALQGVTLVTRTEDQKPNLHLHRLLQAVLEFPETAWHHHRIIADESGQPLTKRSNAPSLRSLRKDGWTAERVWEELLTR
jgi:glutamyl-Q tRNA(Asp) synthetase